MTTNQLQTAFASARTPAAAMDIIFYADPTPAQERAIRLQASMLQARAEGRVVDAARFSRRVGEALRAC
jgi:hypothetical protein